jgi:hypothetical protein
MIRCALCGLLFLAISFRAYAQLPELQPVDLTGWDCLSKLEGAARSEDGKERNRQKNRSPQRQPKAAAVSFAHPAAFLKRMAEYDRQIGKNHRRYLTTAEKETIAQWESQIVSLTGWLVLAYRAPVPESANCRSQQFQDWHLELSPEPADHPAQIGDPTPVICEITPRTEQMLYASGVRIQKLAAFLRLPDNSFAATGSKPHKVTVSGYLLWDDEHNKGDNDVGSYIGWFSKEGYHHPWRSSGWEIHPVFKVEDLGTQ